MRSTGNIQLDGGSTGFRKLPVGTLGRGGVFRGSMVRSASARHMARSARIGLMARSALAINSLRSQLTHCVTHCARN
eukprot:5555892-Prymnesium_polylepis.1